MANEQITREEVEHVANLAKLTLTDAEVDMFTDHLEKIFEVVTTLAEVDTEGVKPTYSVTEMHTVLRDDVAVNAHQSAELLANAPEHTDTLIKVPAILDEGAEG
ncbi:asparaginyl/glutamyl-tRNA amidotransferase subunit C [Weissella confusa]|uniref:Asp-tRNA(Asn)/Glu-tRNA(Gln) amidotransferase subunit GatC n=1 Tax=Weissella confusa TaxID=1583 RepID=UPI0008FE355D|nr:Asp-tRNA(Asn)/Glu-tRNA(Gln) amidotransferase subunit GatC [Weissella confusa]OJF03523.1 asparaginyl/glutamyl-tRNA amidotransferase subunit C [Weissella confusa]